MAHIINKDAEMLAKLSEHTGLSVSKIAERARLATTTLTRVANHRTGHRLSTPTMEALRECFPTFFDESERVVSERNAYLPVEILPSFAGMGGGGTGEGDKAVAMVSRRLIEEKLRATPKDLLIIDVRGDSMAPDFLHGDQILVDRRDRDPVQPGPFALWDGDGYVVKLVERIPQRRGWYRVFSINERYTPYEVNGDEIRILGRPVWYAREL
ncbi:S24 family peptidase [Sphingobium sp. CFD-1]|uniref:S24 family peptidase n=1 Tax=Sphingobium sp. CFD-1 TaxID=2878545 RepID=UPI00214C9DC4|nr:S24 family peptidase [Sphingobium sp. CFD-1]